jgi:hypothetical protein
MQYQRHNFSHNFLNAVETDHVAAWDILINEINEIVLEFPKETEKAIRDNGMRLHSGPSPRDLVDVIHEGIYVNDKLRNDLLKLIAKRHTDPYYSANGGEFDKILMDGEVKKDLNIDGDLLNDDGELINFIFGGAKKLVGNIKDRVGNKKQATDSLSAKEKQRNLAVSKSKSQISTNKIIGISVAVIAGISLIGFIIYRVNKSKQA